MRTILLAIGVLFLTVGDLAAAHEWQTGRWAVPVAAAGVRPLEGNYAIETEQFHLEVQDTIGPGRRPLTVKIETSVTFAIENDIVYVRQGKVERALRLVTRTPTLKLYPAAGAGHYLKVVGAEGLTVTLEDGSVWALDPTAQDRTAHWEPLAGIIVTYEGDQSDSGFNYFLNNTDEDAGALARLTPRP